jgi:type I restriction enzyme S subunit
MSVPALRFKGFSGEWGKDNLLSLNEGGFANGIFNDPKKVGRGYKLVNVLDMYIDGTIDERRLSLVDIDTTEFNKNKVENGDLFFTRSSLVKEGIAYSNTYLGQSKDITFDGHLIRMRPKKELINSLFLNYLLRTSNPRRQLVKRGKTATMTTIGQADIATVNVIFPSLPEQTKIANFLTAVDEKISLLTQKATLLSQYKKGVMQQIFSQELRFKDDGQEFPEWEEKTLGEVFKVTRGNVLSMTLVSESRCEDNPYPVYSSQTKNNGLSGYFNSYLYQDSITWTTDGANAGDVNFRQGKFYCTNVCGVLINDEGQANTCVAELINAVSKKYVSYVGNPKLMNNVMAKIEIKFPSVKEQTKIANFLTAIDDKITNNQIQLNAVKQYKQGLLQQMFV